MMKITLQFFKHSVSELRIDAQAICQLVGQLLLIKVLQAANSVAQHRQAFLPTVEHALKNTKRCHCLIIRFIIDKHGAIKELDAPLKSA
jgi:hypothetical protein